MQNATVVLLILTAINYYICYILVCNSVASIYSLINVSKLFSSGRDIINLIYSKWENIKKYAHPKVRVFNRAP